MWRFLTGNFTALASQRSAKNRRPLATLARAVGAIGGNQSSLFKSIHYINAAEKNSNYSAGEKK
jgi:hypothetical protein